jgi:hypothetical protein
LFPPPESPPASPTGWIVFFCFFGLLIYQPPASARESRRARGPGNVPFHVEVQDKNGTTVAGPEIYPSSAKAASALLTFARDYQPSDRIVLGGPQRMAIRLDESMPECLIYFPASPRTNATYEIPYGREEKETGSAYDPGSFAGKSHRVAVRALNKQELTGYRNLALNPCDQPLTEQQTVQMFPHASSNSFSRNLFDFHARNAIDGNFKNGHHGVWPYESWGPGLRTDIWWKVDFGRPVALDKIRIMERADFPHDSYWKNLDVEFSDGSRVPIALVQSAEFQEFRFSKRKVTWVRITNPVPADPTRWCSLIEAETWGHDLPWRDSNSPRIFSPTSQPGYQRMRGSSAAR